MVSSLPDYIARLVIAGGAAVAMALAAPVMAAADSQMADMGEIGEVPLQSGGQLEELMREARDCVSVPRELIDALIEKSAMEPVLVEDALANFFDNVGQDHCGCGEIGDDRDDPFGEAGLDGAALQALLGLDAALDDETAEAFCSDYASNDEYDQRLAFMNVGASSGLYETVDHNALADACGCAGAGRMTFYGALAVLEAVLADPRAGDQTTRNFAVLLLLDSFGARTQSMLEALSSTEGALELALALEADIEAVIAAILETGTTTAAGDITPGAGGGGNNGGPPGGDDFDVPVEDTQLDASPS